MRIPRKKTEFDTMAGDPGDPEDSGGSGNLAYGIEAVYTLSFPIIFIYHLLSVIAWSGFWAWWLARHPNDLQNASGPMLAYFVILASLWVIPARINSN